MERPKPLQEGKVTEGTLATYCGLCLGVMGLWCSSFRNSPGRIAVSDHATTPIPTPVKDCPDVIKFMNKP